MLVTEYKTQSFTFTIKLVERVVLAIPGREVDVLLADSYSVKLKIVVGYVVEHSDRHVGQIHRHNLAALTVRCVQNFVCNHNISFHVGPAS